MNRRDALKRLSIGMGYSLSAASLATMLHACQSGTPTATIGWQPTFFQPGEAKAISNILDLLLPTTNTPSASEVGVDQLCDLIIADVYEPEDQEDFRKGMAIFFEDFANDNALQNATTEQLTALVEKHTTKVSAADQQKIKALLDEDEAPSDPTAASMFYRCHFWNSLRHMAISGYFSTEAIATEHLVYSPVPGPYQGCIPASEVGGTWAL